MRVFSGGGGAAQGNSYVDRGDPAAADFAVGDFTTDASWNDLDLSSIVPAGAVAVHLYVVINDNAAGSAMLFRKNGNSNAFNIGRVATHVTGITESGDVITTLDSNRVIEYWGTNVAFVSIDVTVKGWFI